MAALCIYPIENLRWEIQLQDALVGNKVQAEHQEIEKAFGGLGSLTIVLQSPDSSANYSLAKKMSQTLSLDPLVHYVEYDADLDFFKKNRLLYASEEDLAQVIEDLDKIKDREIRKRNPILVDLQSTPASADPDSTSIIKHIEEKYFKSLK